jgi:hypothetical protein
MSVTEPRSEPNRSAIWVGGQRKPFAHENCGLTGHLPICDLCGVDFPLLAFSHCRDVVAAVTNAGGCGVLDAAAHTPEELESIWRGSMSGCAAARTELTS